MNRLNRIPVSETALDQWRLQGTLVRVVRDYNPENDVIGLVAAWNDQKVILRKRNKKVVELFRTYLFQIASEPRVWEVPE